MGKRRKTTALYVVVTASGALDADQREALADALESLSGQVRRDGWHGGAYGEGDPEDAVGYVEIEANVVELRDGQPKKSKGRATGADGGGS